MKVCITNLTEQMVRNFDNGLRGWAPYVGVADLSFGCRLKSYLSSILPGAYLKLRNTMFAEHEDDIPNSQNRNLRSLPFGNFGYNLRSLQGMLQGIFLDYKIERPAVFGGETDAELHINAIHESPLPISQLGVVVDDRGFGLPLSGKGGHLAAHWRHQ